MMGKIFRWAVVLVLLVILISGSVAFYTVFFGGKDLVIPPLREMSVLDAVDEAERLGLAVKIEQVDSSIPSGTVLAQWPEPGTKVRKDKSIILKVSKGGNPLFIFSTIVSPESLIPAISVPGLMQEYATLTKTFPFSTVGAGTSSKIILPFLTITCFIISPP